MQDKQENQNQTIIHITHKNLITFMENETYFRKSGYL